MAIVTVDTSTNVREALRGAFPNVKFSVRKERGDTLRVAILKSNIFPDGVQGEVNLHHLPNDQSGRFLSTVEKIIKKSGKWYDNTDIGEGVFDQAFFYKITIGDDDNPHELVKEEK